MLSVLDIACVRILGILIFTLENSCCWNALLESNNLTRCGKDLGQTETEAIGLGLKSIFSSDVVMDETGTKRTQETLMHSLHKCL